MGSKGLELAYIYPDCLPQEQVSRIVYKSMPMGAKHGDFSSSTCDNLSLSSYVFQIKRDGERDNIAAILAIFDNTDYNPYTIKSTFEILINELSRKNLLSLATLTDILPKLYDGIKQGKFKIQVVSSSEISFNFGEDDVKKKTSNDKALDDFSNDLW